MDHRERTRIIEARVAAEREARRSEGADLAGEAWRHRCEALHVLSLSADARERHLREVGRMRNPLAALRLMDDSAALERELFTDETQDAFEDLFA